MNPVADAFIEAAAQAGHERNPDFNGARQEGFGRYQVTQENGMRASTSVRYLHPNMERENLTVITDALALRVLFDGDRACGVEVDHAGTVEEVHASREVDPVRRRLPVTAAADALGHRARRGAAAARHRGPPGPAGRRGPAGPLHDADQLEGRLRVADDGADAGERRAARRPRDAARCRRTSPRPGASSAPAPASTRRTASSTARRRCSSRRASGVAVEHGVGFGPGVVKPTSRGSRDAAHRQPVRQAAHPAQLPVDRGGPRDDARRRQGRACRSPSRTR